MLNLLFAAADSRPSGAPAARRHGRWACPSRRPAPSACPPPGSPRSTTSSSAASRPAAIPGAAVVVGRKGAAVWEKGFGRLGWTSEDASRRRRTRRIYDLASLTKVVGTTTAAHDPVRRGQDSPRRSGRRSTSPSSPAATRISVTIRMLLEHRSGLPAGRDLWRIAHTPEEARAAVIATPLVRRARASTTSTPTSAPTCSASSSKQRRGQPLDQFLAERVFTPLGMTDTYFRPDALAARPHRADRGHPAARLSAARRGARRERLRARRRRRSRRTVQHRERPRRSSRR